MKRIRPICMGLAIGVLSACGLGQQDDLEQHNPVFTGVNFVGVSVRNLSEAVDFYSSTVNLTPVHSRMASGQMTFGKWFGGSNTPMKMQLMRSSNAQLLFMEFAPSPDAPHPPSSLPVFGPGIAHVCYQVNQRTQSYQRALQAGATHIGDAAMVQLNPKNPVQYAYARDKDGIILEIEHVDVDALNLPEPPKNDYRIRHVSLATPDMNRLLGFYSTLLEQHKPRRVGRFFKLSGSKLDKVSGEPNSEIEMAWFQLRNLELEIIQYHSHNTDSSARATEIDAPGYNMIVLEASDLIQARELFLKAGGKIISEGNTELGGEAIFGLDPDGNLLGLHATERGSALSSQHFSSNGI